MKDDSAPQHLQTAQQSRGETPWIDAWIRWERNSKDVYDDDECEDDSDQHEVQPTDTYSYRYQINSEDDESAKSICINLKGFDADSEAIWNSTGLTIWRSSHHLCEYLVRRSHALLRGNSRILQGDRRILELGSGLGRCGILAHLLSSPNTNEGRTTRTMLTDGDTDVLKQLRRNVQRNISDDDETVSCHQLLWGESKAKDLMNAHCRCENSSNGKVLPFHVILGSDLIYVPSVIQPLFETVSTLIHPTEGVFVMAHCARRQGNEVDVGMVLDGAERVGLRYELVEEDEDIFIYEFRRKGSATSD